MGEKFRTYLFIEAGIWLPAAYLFCWRFQPSVRFVSTPEGRAIAKRASEFIERVLPSWHASIMRLTERVYSSKGGRTTAEWILLNKVLAPVSFPTKIWLAHKWVESRSPRGVPDGDGVQLEVS